MLVLKKELYMRIVKQCEGELPNEACGILAGKGGKVEKVYEMNNTEKSPETFFMDAKEQFKAMKDIRNSGLEMLGIYHSHVASPAYPSSRDIELAFYPETAYLIISLSDKSRPCARSFRIIEERIIEENLLLED